MPWFAIKLLGLPRWLWVIAALVLIIGGGLLWAKIAEDADDKRNVEIGRTIEREEALTETITQIEEANDAREDNRTRTVEQRNADCVRRSRTPENC